MAASRCGVGGGYLALQAYDSFARLCLSHALEEQWGTKESKKENDFSGL